MMLKKAATSAIAAATASATETAFGLDGASTRFLA